MQAGTSGGPGGPAPQPSSVQHSAGALATPAEAGLPHPRLLDLPIVRTVKDDVVPADLCRELVFVLKASSTVGYRPHVRSATVHDVVATAPWLLPPLVRARAAVLAAVEAAFGLSLELCVEFSGLIGWAAGASLGWHHDANREYLSQRHLSAVLYLNDQGVDFGAGDFRFRDGPGPLVVAPRAGRLVAYTADARNVHCVEEVAWGERATLTVWFSLEPAAAEDGKVLEQLQRYADVLQPSRPPPGLSEPPTPTPTPTPTPAPLPLAASAGTAAACCDDSGDGSPSAAPSAVSIPIPAPQRAAWEPQERQHKRQRQQPEAGSELPSCEDSGPGGGTLAGPPPGEPVVRMAPGLWLGRGLPDTMYQLRGACGCDPAGDLRLERIRQHGLRVDLQPPNAPAGSGVGGSSGAPAAEAQQPSQRDAAVCNPSSSRARHAGSQGPPIQASGSGALASSSQPPAARREGSSASSGTVSAGTVAVPALTASGSDSGVPVRIWVVSDENGLGPNAPNPAGAPGSAAACGGDVTMSIAPQAIGFASLHEALVAVEFASYKLGSARQLDAALAQLIPYVAERTQELRRKVPTWLALGSLLS